MSRKSICETSKDVTKFKNYYIYIYTFVHEWKAGYLKNSSTFLDRKPITLPSIHHSSPHRIKNPRAFTSLVDALEYVKYDGK